MSDERDIQLHEIEPERRDQWSVRIAVPGYDPDDPGREVGAGWFSGKPQGIMVRGRVADLRSVARILMEAADQIEAMS